MNAIKTIPNAYARRIFLDRHLLSGSPAGLSKGSSLTQLITTLGFVQVDSINTIARAHDLILYSRRNSYRPENLEHPLQRSRQLFEHWTHDASIIPMEFRPFWQLKCLRDQTRLKSYWKAERRAGFEEKFPEILNRIREHGPVCSADVGTDEKKSSGGWWDWHPSKTALEFLWRSGALSVTKREGFRKYYDLTERVVPAQMLNNSVDEQTTIDWACHAAMTRLGFATSREIAAFWDMITPAEAKAWCAKGKAEGTLVEVEIECVGAKPRLSFAFADLPHLAVPDVTNRLRVLSPFDPALRDRARAERLFGFDYRIEIFVPEAKRKYGYYVFPVIEGTRLIGRIDMKADRKSGTLNVTGFWPEPGVKMGKGRLAKLSAELDRIATFTGSKIINHHPEWLKT